MVLGLVGGIEGVEIFFVWWFVGLLVVLSVKEGCGFLWACLKMGINLSGEYPLLVSLVKNSCDLDWISCQCEQRQ